MPSNSLNAQQKSVVDWLNEVADRGGAIAWPGGIEQFKRELVQRLDALPVTVPNQAGDAITLFYSGPIGDQVKGGWEVAESIGEQSNGKVVTIGETPLGALQNDKRFGVALVDAAGADHKHLVTELTEGTRPNGTKVESIWDRASARLADGARGDVRTVTPYAADEKVFATKELPALLNNPQVTHINGVPIEAYREIHARTPGPEAAKLSQVNQAVQASSYELTRSMRWSEVPNTGRGAGHYQVDPGALFEGTSYQQAAPRLAANQASFDAAQADPSLTPERRLHIQQGREALADAVNTVTRRAGSGAAAGANAADALGTNAARAADAAHAPNTPHTPHIRAGTVLKGLGIAGTAYGVYQGVGEFNQAIDGATSTRDLHIRGAEAGADLAVRAGVSGSAATVGGVVGGAGGTLVAPGPGTVAGAVVAGGAAAYGAERAYEGSRVQQWSRALGREFGEVSYDHFSREGRLLNQMNGLKEDLAEAATPAERQRLQRELGTVGEAFKTEADKNNAYYEGRAQIEKNWEGMATRFPDLDKGDVVNAYEARLDAGKSPADAVRAAYSDTVHGQLNSRALPYVPEANYAAYDNKSLQAASDRYATELARDRDGLKALETQGPAASRVPLVGGWLNERSHQSALETARDAQWRDSGHVSAIGAEMRSRGLAPQQSPLHGRSATVSNPGPETNTVASPSAGPNTGRPATHSPTPTSAAVVAGNAAADSASNDRHTATPSPMPSHAPNDPHPLPQASTAAHPARIALGAASQQVLADSEQSVRGVASRHNLVWDQGMVNTCYAVAAASREMGLTRVNLFKAGDGELRFGHYDGITIRESKLDASTAANTPAQHSHERMAAADARATERQPAAQAVAMPPQPEQALAARSRE